MLTGRTGPEARQSPALALGWRLGTDRGAALGGSRGQGGPGSRSENPGDEIRSEQQLQLTAAAIAEPQPEVRVLAAERA